MSKFWIVILASISLTFPAAAESTLTFESMESYRLSLLEAANELGPDQSKKLLLSIVALSVGKADDPAKQFAHFAEQSKLLKEDEGLFLSRMQPYEGLSAQEIIDAASEMD